MTEQKKKPKKVNLYTAVDLAVIGMYYFGIPIIALIFLGFSRETVLSLATFYFVKWFVTTKILKLDPLTILDEMFLLDYPENRANILTVMKVSKCQDVDQFRKFMVEKVTAYSRARSKLVKKFHEFYF